MHEKKILCCKGYHEAQFTPQPEQKVQKVPVPIKFYKTSQQVCPCFVAKSGNSVGNTDLSFKAQHFKFALTSDQSDLTVSIRRLVWTVDKMPLC